MIKTLLNYLIKYSLFSVLIIGVGLVGLGNLINTVVPWIWLDYFLKIIRNFLELAFFWDTDSLIEIILISLNITIAYWVLKAVLLIAHMAKKN